MEEEEWNGGMMERWKNGMMGRKVKNGIRFLLHYLELYGTLQ